MDKRVNGLKVIRIYNLDLVPRVGFEPTTLGLEVLCSILLSYRGMGLLYLISTLGRSVAYCVFVGL